MFYNDDDDNEQNNDDEINDDNEQNNDEKSIKPIKKRGRKSKNNLITEILSNSNRHIIDNKININSMDNEIIFEDYLEKIDVKVEDNNSFIEKYKPKNIKNVIGNHDKFIKIKEWLLNFKNSEYNSIIISGKHGIGKNLIIKLLLEDTHFEKKYIYNSFLKNKDILKDIINNYSKKKKLHNFINNSNEYIKYAIIFSDAENISLSSEKEKIIELLKINMIKKYFPIIFICNSHHSKLINIIKKNSLEITLDCPNDDEVIKYIKNICSNENIIIKNNKIYNMLISFSQNDIRRLLYILDDLKHTYNSEITIEILKEYCSLSNKKNIDIGLYTSTNILLNNYKNINVCMQLYENEKVLLPLTIYENYYKKIFKQKYTTNQILNIITNISNSISIGDIIETIIYADQNWFLQSIYGFYTCVNTCYNINQYNNHNIIKDMIDYNIEFSADLNKTSSKNINKKKNIVNIQNIFKTKNIMDILYINKIFCEGNDKKINNTKNFYDLNSKNISMTLKIDKTYNK